MGAIQANGRSRGRNRACVGRSCGASCVLAILAALLAAGCHHAAPLDTLPLVNAGMNYDAVERLKALNIEEVEVAEVAKVREAGFSDSGCVQLLQIFRGQGRKFDGGDTVAGLIRAGMGEETILELAKLNQLGLGAGELEAMRLTGLSDEILLEVARHHAEGKPVLSGVSLANLKNAGLLASTLLELVRRGVPDSEVNAIVSYRRHGAKDAQILRHFSGT